MLRFVGTPEIRASHALEELIVDEGRTYINNSSNSSIFGAVVNL